MSRMELLLDADLIEECAAKGLSQEMICQTLGISVDTFARRLKDNAKVADAYKRGKQSDIQDVVNALKYNAIEKNNVIAQIFFLKNKDRQNWKDQQELKHSGDLTINTGFKSRPIKDVN